MMSQFKLFFSGNLPFEKTVHIRNPWNENKPVKISRDGQVQRLFTRVAGMHGSTYQPLLFLGITCKRWRKIVPIIRRSHG